MPTFTNKLIGETSPYLLQHAHNPVDWNPWSKDMLAMAHDLNKPILVSIGYAACHWCHVMERESFENEDTARFMNEHFINIKIDREERPDLDHIYMDAVQAMTGSGGWPLNVFLTPDGKPFYGGTYFPPVKAFNRASWMDVLQGVSSAFNERREEIEQQAENLTGHMLQANAIGGDAGQERFFTREDLDESYDNSMKNADLQWGGFGKAPKFPQTFTIRFLLAYYYTNSDSEWAAAGRDQALLSLDKMIQGGIYDQLGGGFARYSTDEQWLAPHFEKMLYDNALLLGVLSDAYQLTGMPRYREVIGETMDFIEREFLHPNNGFYAALDADSEGEEGKFYIWDKKEVDAVLGEASELFCRYYDITDEGNWAEHPGRPKTNILRVLVPLTKFAEKNGINEELLRMQLQEGRQKLMASRSERIRPGLDDKIILGWNALMNNACSKAFQSTGTEKYRQMAIANMNFLLQRFGNEGKPPFFHTWKNDQARYPAFLDDYAYLIEALISLQEITMDPDWLLVAKELVQFVLDEFREEEGPLFYYTGKDQDDVILRKKEVYDGAVPSGNAVMAANLYRLGILLDEPAWKEQAAAMLRQVGELVIKYPGSFGVWNSLLLEMVNGTQEIAILGKDVMAVAAELMAGYLPHRVLMVSDRERDDFPLLRGKKTGAEPLIYLCKDFACLQPVTTVEALRKLINSRKMAY